MLCLFGRHSDNDASINLIRCAHIWRRFMPSSSRSPMVHRKAENRLETSTFFNFWDSLSTRFNSEADWALIQHISHVVVAVISLNFYIFFISLLRSRFAHSIINVNTTTQRATTYKTSRVFMLTGSLTSITIRNTWATNGRNVVEGIVEDRISVRMEERRSRELKKWEFYVSNTFHFIHCVK